MLESLIGYVPTKIIQNDAHLKGFLVFTDKEKYAIYLPVKVKDKKAKKLFALSEKLNNAYPRNVQWVSYMNQMIVYSKDSK